MRRTIRKTVLLSTPIILAACNGGPQTLAASTPLTRVGTAVQVTDNTTSVQECEYIVELPLESIEDENAMRNQAGTLGANTVLLVRGPGGTIVRVEGYLCAD